MLESRAASSFWPMDSVLLETPADATATEKRHDDHQRIDHFARVASERGIKIDVDPDGTVHYNSEAGVQKRKKHRSPSERARSSRRGHEHAYRRLHGHDPPDDRDSIDENVNQEGDRIVLEVSAVDAAQDAAASVAASMVASAVAVQVAQVKEAAIVQEARAAADEVAEEAAADEVAAEEAAAEEAAASFDEEEQCYFDLSMSAMDAARDAAASVAAAAATLEMATRTPHAPVRNAPPTPKLRTPLQPSSSPRPHPLSPSHSSPTLLQLHLSPQAAPRLRTSVPTTLSLVCATRLHSMASCSAHHHPQHSLGRRSSSCRLPHLILPHQRLSIRTRRRGVTSSPPLRLRRLWRWRVCR